MERLGAIMSTRATYKFAAHGYRAGVCFYVYHDGYPVGAASKFLEAIKFSPDAGNSFSFQGPLSDRFFRANKNAEFTEDHDSHGDTEWRYTFDPANNRILVEEVIYGAFDKDTGKRLSPDTWQTYFFGPLVEFIKQEAKSEEAANMGFKIGLSETPIEFEGGLYSAFNLWQTVLARVPYLMYSEDNPNRQGVQPYVDRVKFALKSALGDSFKVSLAINGEKQ